MSARMSDADYRATRAARHLTISPLARWLEPISQPEEYWVLWIDEIATEARSEWGRIRFSQCIRLLKSDNPTIKIEAGERAIPKDYWRSPLLEQVIHGR